MAASHVLHLCRDEGMFGGAEGQPREAALRGFVFLLDLPEKAGHFALVFGFGHEDDSFTELSSQQLDFLRRLQQARSTNSFDANTSPPDAPLETEVVNVIYNEFRKLGFHAELHGVSPQRLNILCRLQGSGKSSKTLILTTHMDTVEPTGYTRDPWGAQIENGRLYGVGVADAKAQIAAFTYAVSALRRSNIVAAHTNVSYTLEDVIVIPAVEIEPGTKIVQALKNTAEQVTGKQPRVEGSGPACDGWMFITCGIPAVCGNGVASGGTHGSDEWIDLESLRAVTEIYARTVLQYFETV